jgi:very-short-patch-repair endonuclease
MNDSTIKKHKGFNERITKKSKNCSKEEYVSSEKRFTWLADTGKVLYWPPLKYEQLASIRKTLNNRLYPSEKWFENELKLNRIKGFLRNWPIANRFFADFFFPAANIVVEIDGKEHDKLVDQRRDSIFRQMGLRVYRIKHNDIYRLQRVIADLRKNPNCCRGFILQRKKVSEADMYNFFPPEVKPTAPTPEMYVEKPKKVILIKKAGKATDEATA